MRQVLSVLTAVGTLSATAVSQAATIDFTDTSVGSLAAGNKTYTYADAAGTDVDVTVAASSGKISFEEGDGLGVQSWTDRNNAPSIIADDWEKTTDEINQYESLKISFSSAVEIQSVTLTDLYASPDSGRWDWVPDEAGTWTLKDATGKIVASGTFEGAEQRNPDGTSNWTSTGTNGELVVDIGAIASAITFVSNLKGAEGYYKGFSVASVTFGTVAVPELSSTGASSAAFLLAGVAFLFAGERRRRVVRPVQG